MSSGAAILAALVAAVTVLGFLAARWRPAKLNTLDEWALGGRNFGTLVSWFLLGGDLYTAYTFIAVPALVYGVGALGFFAVPYATIAYPIALIVLSRFWSVARERGYVTTADFVRDRFGDRSLEVVVALTGVVAALPYIALQLVGMRAVFGQFNALGVGHAPAGADGRFRPAGGATRIPAGCARRRSIAFVKDTLIYVTVIAAIVVIPAQLGGWAHVFAVSQHALGRSSASPRRSILAPPQYFTLRHDGVRVVALALHLSALDHQRAGGAQPRGRAAQRRAAADLLAAPRTAGAARLLRHRRRSSRPKTRAASCRCSSRTISPSGSPAWPMRRS